MRLRKDAREEMVRAALHRHEFALVEYASRMMGGDTHGAQDVVQDAFIKLCRQDPEALGAHVKAWLYRVVRNGVLDALRKSKRVIHLDESGWDLMPGGESDPLEISGMRDGVSRLMSFLDRLPTQQKDVVLLKFQQGMNYKEISSVTGLSVGNVGFLLHTAMKRLRNWLDKLAPEFI